MRVAVEQERPLLSATAKPNSSLIQFRISGKIDRAALTPSGGLS
jgi:hypothetical protein